MGEANTESVFQRGRALRVVYIAHPLGRGDDREANRRRAARWVAWAGRCGVAPVADWIILSGEWAETPELREAGLAIDVALVSRCDEVWLVGGRISKGMGIEAQAAIDVGVGLRDLTFLGDEPPASGTEEAFAAFLRAGDERARGFAQTHHGNEETKR